MDYSHQIFDSTPKVVLSPHYDDFIFSLGGLVWHWSNQIKPPITNIVLFSQSGYASGQNQYSSSEVAAVSQLRLEEEQRALSELNNTKLILGRQSDAPLRGYRNVTKPGYFKLLSERVLRRKLADLIATAFCFGGQVFIPLAVGNHVDHLLVRDVSLKLIKSTKLNRKISVYFYEDLPYAGSVKQVGRKNVSSFIKNNGLMSFDFKISLAEKMRLVDFYPSQLNEKVISEIKSHAGNINQAGDFERIWRRPQ